MPFINTLALLVFVAASAGAQHAHGGHQRLHEKRDLVMTTVTDYVTTTVNVTTTIWVDPWATSSSSSSSSTISSSVIVATPAVTTPTTFVTSTSSSQQPAEFHEETKSVAAPAPAQSSSSVFVPPPPPPPPTSSTAPPPPPPSPAFVPPPTSTTPVVVVPAATSPPPASPPPSGGGSGLPCTPGSPCTGDITYYDAGVGACGKDSNGLVENVIALPFGMMGEKSNDNPFCGLTVTITKNGQSAVATVVDKCMGCVGDAIDLSHHVWKDLGVDENLGRTQATWYFN